MSSLCSVLEQRLAPSEGWWHCHPRSGALGTSPTSCLSVHPSIHPSIRSSIHPSIRSFSSRVWGACYSSRHWAHSSDPGPSPLTFFLVGETESQPQVPTHGHRS